jgi:hypothetical protein
MSAAEMIEAYRQRGYRIMLMVSSTSWSLMLQNDIGGIQVRQDDLPDDFELTDKFLRDCVNQAIERLGQGDHEPIRIH